MLNNTPNNKPNKTKKTPARQAQAAPKAAHEPQQQQQASNSDRKRPSNEDLVDELLERAGGVSTFHVLFYLAVSSGANCIRAFMNHLIPFLIQKQDYKCTFTEDLLADGEDLCTQENICDGHP